MLLHKLTDGARHGQAQVGVNVDLADGQLCGLPQLILRYADGVGHFAAMLVNHLDILLRDRRRTVQHNGEAGKALGYLLQNVKAQRRRH